MNYAKGTLKMLMEIDVVTLLVQIVVEAVVESSRRLLGSFAVQVKLRRLEKYAHLRQTMDVPSNVTLAVQSLSYLLGYCY